MTDESQTPMSDITDEMRSAGATALLLSFTKVYPVQGHDRAGVVAEEIYRAMEAAGADNTPIIVRSKKGGGARLRSDNSWEFQLIAARCALDNMIRLVGFLRKNSAIILTENEMTAIEGAKRTLAALTVAGL